MDIANRRIFMRTGGMATSGMTKFSVAKIGLFLAIFSLTPGTVCLGQVSARGLISPEALAPLGLEMAWSTQIEVDRGSDRVVDVTQHVSAAKVTVMYEFTFDHKLYNISERDRDAFGVILGPDGAKKKADQTWAQIKLEYAARGLPEPAPPTMVQRVLPEITLYATTQRGMIHAIDGNTGKTRWATSVGKNRYPTTAAGGSDKYVAVVNGSTLYVLRAADGTFAWSLPIGGVPAAGPAVSDALIFVPRINGAVELYKVEDHKRPAAVYKAFGGILVQPVVSYNSVAWPTDKGHLYVGFANQQAVRFRVEAKDGIIAQPFFTPTGKLLATSMDGYIYCIDEARGDLLWRFTTGEPIDISPIAIDDTVYAITREHNLYAVNLTMPNTEDPKKKGWVVSGVGGLLSGSDNRLYCTDVTGNMLVLDSRSGALLGSLPTSTMTLKMPNLQTDRIFLGQNTGLLQCIRQTDLKYPLVHYNSEPGKKRPPAGVPAGPAAQPMPMPMGVPIDPFADPAPAAPMPMPKPMAPVVDPFAP
jgi:outer membrane protein assembly factor BamB